MVILISLKELLLMAFEMCSLFLFSSSSPLSLSLFLPPFQQQFSSEKGERGGMKLQRDDRLNRADPDFVKIKKRNN
jgi:hypothetical protein